MAADMAFIQVWIAGCLGLLPCLCADFLIQPAPAWKRPPACWLAQIGLWGMLFSLLVLLLGRVWCAMAAALAFVAILVLVNNAKYKSLREPFLFQDYDYFLDTIRFPRLFLPFLGVKSFLLCALGCLLAIGAMFLENPPQHRFSLTGQAGGALLLFLFSGCLLWFSKRLAPKLFFNPVQDLLKLGFIPFLWFYGLASREKPHVISPFANIHVIKPQCPPNFVAIQSESFFDPRPVYEVVQNFMKNLDLCAQESFLHGELDVPAWGANTIRTEFSFLTGLSPEQAGIHRFSPYQIMARGWHPETVATFLHGLGYHTVCIHPYYRAFYGRNKIFPAIGFDSFLDMHAFPPHCANPYIGDLEVGKKILEIMGECRQPIFIFVITMENHGPLQMEKNLSPEEEKQLFRQPPPASCRELGIYLRHERHADAMLGMLYDAWQKDSRPVSLCFYGDHVPIMPECYQKMGEPDGRVPYFCWTNVAHCPKEGKVDLPVWNLARAWLKPFMREV